MSYSVEGPCRVALVGMMGSGKSTIGRLLSAASGWTYADNDEIVRSALGMTSRQLLADRGEDALRRAESQALGIGLALAPPAIVGVAAGAYRELDDSEPADVEAEAMRLLAFLSTDSAERRLSFVDLEAAF